MKANLRVNDTNHELSLNPRLTLLDALRHGLGEYLDREAAATRCMTTRRSSERSGNRRLIRGIEWFNVLRGGEYFFMPSISGLNWIANGFH